MGELFFKCAAPSASSIGSKLTFLCTFHVVSSLLTQGLFPSHTNWNSFGQFLCIQTYLSEIPSAEMPLLLIFLSLALSLIPISNLSLIQS